MREARRRVRRRFRLVSRRDVVRELSRRYGLAVECMSSGDTAAADQHFRRLLEHHTAYVPGYLMYGQLLAREARTEEARRVLATGIEAATTTSASSRRRRTR